MTLHAVIALVIATFVLGMSPGPAVFATISCALSLRLRQVYIFIFGIVAGDFIFALLAMLSMASLAKTFAIVFILLRIAGGAFLVYLGALSWKNATKPEFKKLAGENKNRLLASGFMLTSSNPKDLLFFVGFLPLFIDVKTAGLGAMMAAATTITLTFIVTLSIYALGATYVKKWFKEERAVMLLHRAAGVVMIAVGAAVIVGI